MDHAINIPLSIPSDLTVFFRIARDEEEAEETATFDRETLGPCVENYFAGLQTPDGQIVVSLTLPPELVQSVVLSNALFGIDIGEDGLVTCFPHSMEMEAVADADRTAKSFEKRHIDELVGTMLENVDPEFAGDLDDLKERLTRSLAMVDKTIQTRDGS